MCRTSEKGIEHFKWIFTKLDHMIIGQLSCYKVGGAVPNMDQSQERTAVHPSPSQIAQLSILLKNSGRNIIYNLLK